MKKIICLVLALSFVFALCACGDTQTTNTTTTVKNVQLDLSQVMAEIESNITLPENMIDVDSEMLFEYYGISTDEAKSFAAKLNGTGIQCDEIVMIEAADAEAITKIKTSLENRLEDVQNQMNNYLPDEYEIASKCKVEIVGNYVTLFISSDAQRMTELFMSKF